MLGTIKRLIEMKDEIEERIFGLEHIIHGLWHNISLLEFISIQLHRKTFNLSNVGMHWVWTSIMGDMILDLYKLAFKKEKHSFQKILNFCKNEKCELDYELLQKEIDKFVSEYEKLDFEAVRSKYLAHHDLNAPKYYTSIKDLRTLTDMTLQLFKQLTSNLGRKNAEFTDIVTKSFAEIFDTIDEYEKMSTLIFVRRIQGNETIAISEFEDILSKEE